MKLMKHLPTKLSRLLGMLGLAGLTAHADPVITSWHTTYSGKYARIYTSNINRTNGVSVTTWSNGKQNQSLPAYVGVQEIYSSSNWVYLRSSGLANHIMGPWLNGAFPNLPKNQKTLYRIPRTPTVPATKTLTDLGTIGYFVDGVSMFDSRDGFYWNGATESGGMGMGYWNREAYVNEGATFDPGYAHQEQSGTHHYHADPLALRYLLGDHVDFNATTKIYGEGTNVVTKHSPILGWVRDGYPVYGPYGYANANDPASGLARMRSGYVLRNGQSNTANLTAVGRTNIPQWAVRAYNVAANQTGPVVSTTYPLGRYMEDNDYLGDLGYTNGVHFDLDEYNGRFCVTPEFPGGTYAYFVSISSNGTPTFPYNIGRAYYGSPAGAAVASITETVSTNFLGNTNIVEKMYAIGVNGNTVTLTWSAIEGGSYRVEASTNLNAWSAIASNIAPAQTTGSYAGSSAADENFYRVARTSVAAFDSAGSTTFSGGGATSIAPGGSASRGTTVTVTITITSPPNLPPANAPINSVTLAGTIVGTAVSYPSSGTVLATFAIPPDAPTGPQNIVVAFNIPSYTIPGGFTIN